MKRRFKVDGKQLLRALDNEEWRPAARVGRKYGRMAGHSNPSLFWRDYQRDVRRALRKLEKEGRVEARRRLGYRLIAQPKPGPSRKPGKRVPEKAFYPGIADAVARSRSDATLRPFVLASKVRKYKKTPDIMALEQLPPPMAFLRLPRIVSFEVKKPASENPKADLRQAEKYRPFSWRTWVVYCDLDGQRRKDVIAEFEKNRGENYPHVGLAIFSSADAELADIVRPQDNPVFDLPAALEVISRVKHIAVCPWCRNVSPTDEEDGEKLHAQVCDGCFEAFAQKMQAVV